MPIGLHDVAILLLIDEEILDDVDVDDVGVDDGDGGDDDDEMLMSMLMLSLLQAMAKPKMMMMYVELDYGEMPSSMTYYIYYNIDHIMYHQ